MHFRHEPSLEVACIYAMACSMSVPDKSLLATLFLFATSDVSSVSDHSVKVSLESIEESNTRAVAKVAEIQRPFVIASLLRRVMAGDLTKNPINSSLDGKVSSLLRLREELQMLQNLATVKPLSYSIHLRTLLMLFLWTLPLVLIGVFRVFIKGALQLAFTVTLVETIIAFAFCGIDAAAQEAEAPMGDDPNDISVRDYVEAICSDLEVVASTL